MHRLVVRGGAPVDARARRWRGLSKRGYRRPEVDERALRLPMPIDPSATLRAARDVYLAENGLPADGGYDDRWVKIKFGPIPFVFPNSAERKRGVPFHDLHHVMTGYKTDLLGEAQIGAWELASGCTNRAALLLNLLVLGFMLLTRRAELFRAFLRGRTSRNLYGAVYEDALLDRSVADVRAELGIEEEPREPTAADRRAFRRWSAAAIGLNWGPAIALALIAWWLLA